MAGLLDESTGEPDGGDDGVLITGVVSTNPCFVREIELREGGREGFAATITFSSGEGWLAPPGLERAREAFCFWAEEGLVWFAPAPMST